MAFRDFFNVAIKSDLTSLTALTDGQGIALFGENAVGDQPIRVYFFWANSALVADGENVIAPIGGTTNERFVKYGTIPVTPALLNPTPSSISNGTRNFNTAYQVSATRPVEIKVSAQISASLSLTGGQGGEVYLEYSANGSTGWTHAGMISGSNTGALTVGLSTVQVTGGMLSVWLPAGYYWRLRTNNTTGTPTYTFTGGTQTVF